MAENSKATADAKLRAEVTPAETSAPVQAVSPAEIEKVTVTESSFSGEENKPGDTQAGRLRLWWRNLPPAGRRFLTLVVFPTFLALFYFGLWASPMYVSDVQFAVKSAEGGASGLNVMSSFFKVPTSSLQDAMVVETFLKSSDAFNAVDRELDIAGHYASHDYDVISRLASSPTVDEIKDFWTGITKVNVNQDSNVITFEVRAYTPDMAYAINEQILKVSEALVNSMNERAKEDMLELADIEVASARSRLTAAQDALRDFRNQHQDLDLKATAAGMQSLVIELESQAAMLRTEIAEQSRYTDPSAPAIQALQARLDGVMQQIERERSRLTEVPSDGVSINTLASQYENLVTEADFARQQLVFAMTSLENAKADILSKNLYIVTVAKPSLPDESLYPQPFLFTFYVFVALSMAYAVVSLIVAAIREHMGY